MAVVNPIFCVAQETTLVLKEKFNFNAFKDDNFKVVDINGTPWFSLDTKIFSFRDMRTLFDYQKVPILTMKKAFNLMSQKWNAYRGTSTKSSELLFSMETKFLAMKPYVYIYLADGDRIPDFKIKGSFWRKDFQMYDVRNGGEILVAVSRKERFTSGIGAFFKSKILDIDSYYLTIYPGVDSAFVTACTIILDELYNDKK